MGFTIDPHENLIQVPTPLSPVSMIGDTLLPDFGREYGAEPIPPVSDRFMADIDTSFMQKVFDLPQGQWKADIHHHGKFDEKIKRNE
jgi:hypothetical protein